jgi:hypothetical protein
VYGPGTSNRSKRRPPGDPANTITPIEGPPIIGTVARGFAGAARGAANMTASMARHAAWYLRYRVDGNARAQDAKDAQPRRGRG